MILKNVNDTMSEAREKIAKIEEAITGIRGKFEKATVGLSFLVDGVRKIIEYAIDKKMEKKSKKIARVEEELE
jgi:Ni,Fe-hydrogenase III large subunit